MESRFMQISGKYHILIMAAVILYLLWGSVAQAQYIYYDSLTYSQYLDKNWKELIKSSGKAIGAGQDYYYMRMRRAIAFYERKNYLKAELNFRKAEEFNNLESLTREYIYYSRLFSGKDKYARQFYTENSSFLEDKIKISINPVRNFTTDLLYLSRPEKNLSSWFNSSEIQNINGSQLVTKSYSLAGFHLSHELGRKFRMFHQITYLNKNSYLYLQDSGVEYSADVNNIQQMQYCTALGFYPGDDWTIISAGHYIFYKFPSVFMGGRGMGTSFINPSANGNFLAGKLTVYKQLGLIRLGSAISVSNLNFKNQFQKDIHFAAYPLGNLNFYIMLSVFHIHEESINNTGNYLGFQNTIGFKAFSNIWIEGKTQFGEARNLVANDGFNIYNSDETETKKLNLSVLIPRNKHTYRLITSFSESHNYYIDGTGYETGLNKINSSYLTFIGEISWNF